MHGGDAGICRDGLSGAAVVTGEHCHRDTQVFQQVDGLGGFGSQLIAHRDCGDGEVIACEDHYGGTGGLQTRNVTGECAGRDPRRLTEAQPATVEGAVQAVPGHGDDVGGDLCVTGGVQDRLCQWVFAAGLQCCGEDQGFSAADFGQGDDLDDFGLIAGEGAGLVQGNDFDAPQLFNGRTTFDESTLAAGGSDGRDHGQRDGDRQGAWGRGNQHDERPLQPQHGVAEYRACCGNQGGEGHDRRDQWAGDPVGQPLAGAFAFLGFFDDVDDACQRAVGGHGTDFDFDGSAAVDRPGEHRAGRSGFDRD